MTSRMPHNQAGHCDQLPRCPATRCPKTVRAARPTTESCWASTRPGCSTWLRRTPRWRASGVYPPAALRAEGGQTPRGVCCFDATTSDNSGNSGGAADPQGNVADKRHVGDAADRRVFRAATRWPAVGRRPPKTGTTQLGDTDADKDAWMVGYNPVAGRRRCGVGTVKGDVPLVNKWGSPIYGSGLPADILEGDRGRRTQRHLGRLLPQAGGDRRFRRGCRQRRPPARAAANDGHPAHD